VLEIDDLIEPSPEQITFTRRLVLLRPHRALRCSQGIMVRDPRKSKNEIARFQALGHRNPAISKQPKRRK
jgi:hypothetical protein